MVAVIKFILIKVVMPVSAVMMITGALTNFASTAACPNTIVPTMVTAWPIGVGIRVPTSLKISNIKSMANKVKVVGKGTFCREAEKLNNKEVGSIS